MFQASRVLSHLLPAALLTAGCARSPAHDCVDSSDSSAGLDGAEIVALYRRAPPRLRLQLRSCDDAACSGESFAGPDGTGNSFYSEADNALAELPASPLTRVPRNRWAQVLVSYQTDDPSSPPELQWLRLSGSP